MRPTISIIVPIYNVEKYLSRCISSILSQDYNDYEVILVDDGSPDGCGIICDEYAVQDIRFTVIHKENGGLSSARNAGLDIAKGKYVFFLDSDDWIDKQALSSLVYIAQKTGADIVSGSYILTKEEISKSVSENFVYSYSRDEALEYYLRIGMANRVSEYPAWSKLYKKELFENIRFPVGQLYEDVVTVFRLIKKCNLYVKTDKVIYYYYQNASSIIHSKFKLKDLDVIKVGKQLFAESSGENASVCKYAYQKEIRGYFSVLCKIAIYGVDDTAGNWEEIATDCVKMLKSNVIILLKSKMPILRKIILVCLCIDYKITFAFFKMIRRWIR